MGYTTDFIGRFELDNPLTEEQFEYLEAFAATRRMKRNAEIAATLDDPIRKAVGLPVGEDGAYYVGDSEKSVVDSNHPPGSCERRKLNESFEEYEKRQIEEIKDSAQPGLWCQWVPTEDGTAIVWDEGEKFYNYIEWLEYLIKHFLSPWGYTLNGEIEWEGEDDDDRGTISVKNNVVKA